MNKNNENSDIPEEILELVPWYATGKLSIEDLMFFEKALVKYTSLQKTLESEQMIIEKVSADNSILDKSAISNQDERLKSVMNMIDIAEAESKSNRELGSSDSILEKLKKTLNSLIAGPDFISQYSRVASVGILVLSVAVLTAFVAPLFTKTSEFTPASAVVEEDVNKPTLISSSHTTLLVGFKGSSVELGENNILKGKLMKIESVPEKEGMYQISFKQTLNEAEIKKTIAALLLQKDTIWFAGEAF